MVGYDKSEKLTSNEIAVAGLLGGILARLSLQPLDVLKIRFQLQLEDYKSSQAKYKGLSSAFYQITKEEGIRALWKGHLSSQLLTITYIIVQFEVFENMTRVLSLRYPDANQNSFSKLVVHTVSGGSATFLSTVVSYPFDTIRTRLVGQSEPKVYRGIMHAFCSIVNKQGVRKLWLGLMPSLLLSTLSGFVQFGTYTAIDVTLRRMKLIFGNIGTVQSITSGFVAGSFSKLALYPFDVVKKRLQVQGFEEARRRFGTVEKYNGMIDCFIKVFRQEGFFGFYKGIVPSLLKSGLFSSLVFVFYEQTSNFFKFKHKMERLRRETQKAE